MIFPTGGDPKEREKISQQKHFVFPTSFGGTKKDSFKCQIFLSRLSPRTEALVQRKRQLQKALQSLLLLQKQ